MKKVLFGGICGLLLFASCKKDYTCTCSSIDGTTSTVIGSTTINDTKKNAEEECDTGDILILGVGIDCEI